MTQPPNNATANRFANLMRATCIFVAALAFIIKVIPLVVVDITSQYTAAKDNLKLQSLAIQLTPIQELGFRSHLSMLKHRLNDSLPAIEAQRQHLKQLLSDNPDACNRVDVIFARYASQVQALRASISALERDLSICKHDNNMFIIDEEIVLQYPLIFSKRNSTSEDRFKPTITSIAWEMLRQSISKDKAQ